MAAAATAAARLRQTLTLPTGRVVGFAEYGRPQGRPLFYLHGTPSSRLEVGMWDGLCARHDVRMIVPDRPGVGLSTFVPHRTVAEYPGDIAALANHLGWTRFHLLGGSGGGPFALACARSLPPACLAGVGVVAGSGPREAGTEGLSFLGRALAMASRFPRAMAWLLHHSEMKYARSSDHTRFDRMLHRQFASLHPTDRAACERDAAWIAATIRASYAQGSQGPAWELYLMVRPWGFDLGDVAYKGIKLWCGTHDVNTPVGWSRYMAERLPEAALVEMPGLTHYTIFTEEHMASILESFMPAR